MNKTSWIIIASVLVAIGVVAFLFNNFFVVNGWKVALKTTYKTAVLVDELSESTQAGDTDKQIEVAQQLVSQKNDNQSKLDLANAFLEKASLQFKEEEYGKKALVLIDEVLAQEPNNDKAYLAAGYAYEVLQNYPKAFENYNKSIELNVGSEIAYIKRGHAYDLTGDLVKAEDDYKTALEINDKNDVALMNLARIAQRKGDFETAKTYAQIVTEISKITYVKATSYEILGLADLEVDNYSSAIDNFSKSVESYKDYANAYTNRAYAKILMADYTVTSDTLRQEIEQDVLKTLEIYPGDTFAVVVRGLLMEAVSNNVKAKEYYQTALSMVDKDITLGLLEKEDMKGKINQLIINLDNNK